MTDELICETAYAKINLALHVRGRRTDGYHDLETIFAFTDWGDDVVVGPSVTLSLSIDGRFGDAVKADDDNLVLRAARAMQAHFDVASGAAIRLTKELPVAAGLGGGSADAAAAARALARLWNIDADETQLIDAVGALGADIPACILSRTTIATGTGDRFAETDGTSLSGMPLLLANPLVPLSTASVFAAWNGSDSGPLEGADVITSALMGGNDLEPGAMSLCPGIAEGLKALTGRGERLVRMSGSGASIFALYDDVPARDDAALQFSARLPGWWIRKARLR